MSLRHLEKHIYRSLVIYDIVFTFVFFDKDWIDQIHIAPLFWVLKRTFDTIIVNHFQPKLISKMLTNLRCFCRKGFISF